VQRIDAVRAAIHYPARGGLPPNSAPFRYADETRKLFALVRARLVSRVPQGLIRADVAPIVLGGGRLFGGKFPLPATFNLRAIHD